MSNMYHDMIMKEKLTLLIVLVVCWTCAKPERTPESIPAGSFAEIIRGVTIESMPAMPVVGVAYSQQKDIENQSEPAMTGEKFATAYGLSIDIDRLRPMLEDFKKENAIKSEKFADIHVVVNDKEYVFTLEEFIKRIEQ